MNGPHELDEFLTALSHELRTPLTAILLWTDILRADPALAGSESAAEAFPIITQSAERLLAMVEALRDLGRAEAGELELAREPADVLALVRESRAAATAAAESAGLILTEELEAGPLRARLDRARVRRALDALVSNALKFTDPPGQVTLRALPLAGGTRVRIEVEDTGAGIESDELPHVFERFRQGADPRRRGGLGIGLPLARAIIEEHGGTLSVRSTVGRGSTFAVELPLEPSAEAGGASPQSSAAGVAFAARSGQSPARPLTVLLADDATETRQALATVLAGRGFHVVEAADGEEAVQRAGDRLPDIVLMDIAMPRLDGIAALQRLRHDPRTARIPVAAVTARVMPEDRRRLEAAGFDAWLSKPFRLTDLLELLDRLLARAGADAAP